MMKFKSLTDHKVVDVVPYIKDILDKKPNTTIYIGTDSQTIGNQTIYATVIVLHYYKKGAHVLYNKEKMKVVRDSFDRLWREVDKSITIAQYLSQECGIPVKYIDLDYNNDPKWYSNTVLRAAIGYVESMGYEPRYKPLSTYAARVADSILR